MKLKRLVKHLAPVLVVGAYAASASAQSLQCAEALFAYGDEFPIEKLGANVTVKKEVVANPHSDGAPITNTSYQAGESWISTRTCDSCNPIESRNSTYIVVNEPLACGIKKGMTEQQITQIMGPPAYRQNDGSLTYFADMEENIDVTFRMVNGRLQGLMNGYY